MAKATHYKVEGVLTEKPKDLPKDLKVTEIVTDIPTDVTAKSVFGTEFRVRLYSDTPEGVVRLGIKDNRSSPRIDTEKLLDRDNAILLRDALTELIGDDPETRLRHVVDKSGYFADWYELAPNEFYNESSRIAAEASERRGNHSSSLSYIENEFGIKSVSFE